jgi:hypothetical protein
MTAQAGKLQNKATTLKLCMNYTWVIGLAVTGWQAVQWASGNRMAGCTAG